MDLHVSCHREIAAQRQQIELLTEQLRQTTEAFTPRLVFPAEWRLTSSESQVLAALYAAKAGVLSKESLHIAVSGLEVETDEKIVDVFVCKARRKLNRFGVTIETRWGEGYSLPHSARRIVQLALNGEATEPVPAPAVERASDAAVLQPANIEGGDMPKDNQAVESNAPRDLRIDAGVVLLEAARGRAPAQVQILIGAIGVLFDGEVVPRSPVGRSATTDDLPARLSISKASTRKARSSKRTHPDSNRSSSEKPDAVVPQGAVPKAGEIVEHNGVTISFVDGEEKIQHNDLEIEVKLRQARLVACLAAANFLPVAPNFIAKRVWAGEKVPGFYEQIIGQLCREVTPALEQIGLTIISVRGVGRALKKVEA